MTHTNKTITYHRNPTPYEIKVGEGAIHYKAFNQDECTKNDGNLKAWLVSKFDGLRYYR